MYSWGTGDEAGSTRCQSWFGIAAEAIVEQPWIICFLSAKDPESEPAREAVQSGDWRRTLEQRLPRVVAYYPVEVLLWASLEGKESQLVPTFRRCSVGC